jgi:hypothetical protein
MVAPSSTFQARAILCSSSLAASSSSTMQPSFNRSRLMAASPYLPPRVLPGGSSQTTKANASGIESIGGSYQQKSLYCLRGLTHSVTVLT